MLRSKLPIITLYRPFTLLPASQFVIPVSMERLYCLSSTSRLVVAVLPITNQPTSPNAGPVLAEWGTAARVLNLVKPPARNFR